ncbi:MAG TPA: SMP-30/gluconolactonase/LRE family protein [Allosphingosinicella sp.]|nr:SMP-30/gluconolactonase/LRE family protein [Allosphingosinicella sp.]
MKRLILAAALLAAPLGSQPRLPPAPYPMIGGIERLSPRFDALVDRAAPIQRLGEGYRWAEGPVWVRRGNYLLFSDVPANRMYRWSEEGVSVFLDPSGLAGPVPATLREAGSNGLIPGPGNTIFMADSGSRAIAWLDLATRRKTMLATTYRGRRFNSPNDLVLARDGAIYFTDPPYGLAGLNDSPLKEQPVNGVYRLAPDGRVTLIDGALSFPNGIILSPDGRTLYVANSDPRRAIWMAYRLDARGNVASRRVLADVTSEVARERPGLPDGMAIDARGNLFATAPGGILVMAPDGTRLGRIATGQPIANCTFGGADGRTLFMTSNNLIARLRTRTRGLGY